MSPRRALTDEQEAEVAAAYQEGALQAELAAKYGVNPWTIRNAILRQGVPLRPRWNRRDVSTEEITRLRKRGYSWNQIASIVHMGPTSVRARYMRSIGKKP